MFRIMILMTLNCYFQSIRSIFEERDQKRQSIEHGRLGTQEMKKSMKITETMSWHGYPRGGMSSLEDKDRVEKETLPDADNLGATSWHVYPRRGAGFLRLFKHS